MDIKGKALSSWENCDGCNENDKLFYINGYQKGYNQALADNKEIKYTKEDVIRIVEKSRETGLTAEYLLLSLQSKTEQEVEFIDDTLKLVQ